MNPFFLGYLLLFGAAAVTCLVAARRVRERAGSEAGGRDTGNALLALLLTSAGWAGAYVGVFLAWAPGLEHAFHLLGLVLGAAAVGAWLWFCSAYSGRTLHKDAGIRRGALLLFLLVAGTKLTNPWHGLYFSTEPAEVPFAHLALHYHALHWGSVGLAYALAAVGYFMLFDLFRKVGSRGGKLGLLAGLTALPLLFNGLGETVPWLLNVSHEPLGVAAFAIGALFLYQDQFRAVRVAGEQDAPAFVMKADGTLQDYNQGAADLFPERVGEGAVIGTSLRRVLPDVAEALDGGESLVRLSRASQKRDYRLQTSSIALGETRPCRVLLMTDVTEQRRMQERLLDVQQQERRRISQEFHDEIGGLLASLQLAIDLARRQAHAQVAPTDPLSDLEDLVSDLSSAVRTISRKLYPGALSQHGLAGALSSLVRGVEEEHGLDVELKSDVEVGEQFPTLVEQTAYWTAQEALVNAALHAETSTARCVLRTDEDRLFLRVVDDGIGFDPARCQDEKSFGLEGIRRRVERLDGAFEISSAPGRGTRLSVTLPLNPPLPQGTVE